MRFLVINGPNINLLGLREPGIYGGESYAELIAKIERHAEAIGVEVRCVQSNHEGALVDAIQAARGEYEGIVINPAAYTHTSIAILDALKAVALPAVEVHISNVREREEFRRVSYAGMACEASFIGLGLDGYLRGLDFLKKRLAGGAKA
ncbi:MAG: type II 3-dehydroquinate dehydratase [Christensenellaceae bacterium]|jgi:3-dehydroquinate dehydratase-2|nr:type II 3-dehydroquinate dehydratase [Christensenellaceae bacterium]